MSVLLLAALISDPQMTQVLLEGREKDTRIELTFRGSPTFQSFRSHQPNVLVVDVVGAGLPAGFPSELKVIDGVVLHFSEHIGNRTQLMRIRLNLPPRMEPELETALRAIHLTLPRGSTVAKAIGPSGAEPKLTEALATRLQRRLDSLSKEHSTTREHLTQKEEEIERLSRRLTDSLAKVNRLDRSVLEKDRNVASAEKARQQAEGKALAALKAVQATHAQVRGEVTQLRRDKATVDQASAQSLSELEARRSEIDRLLRQQEQIKSKLAALKRVITKQARESKRLVQTEVGLRADVEASQKSLLGRRLELRRINARVSDGERAIGTLAKERKTGTRKIKRADQRIGRRLQDLALVQKEQATTLKSMEKLRLQITLRKKRRGELDSTYVAESDEVALTAKKLQSLRRERTALNKALRGVRRELVSTRKDLKSNRVAQAKVASESGVLRKALASASGERSKLEGQVALARKATVAKKRQLSALRRELAPVAARQDALRISLAAETARAVDADAQVAKVSASLARAKGALKGQGEKLARLRRQRLAQRRRSEKIVAEEQAVKVALAKAAAATRTRSRRVAKPVLVAEAKTKGAKKSVSDAHPSAGFGGGPRVQTGRFERIGYRPVGPERVLVRYGGNSEPSMSKLSKTRTLIRFPGVSATAKRLRPLDTSLFGGLVQSIRPRPTRHGLRLELRHEQGVEFRIVRTASGVELSVR